MSDAVERARDVAERVLLPDAAAVDRGAPIPPRHWAALDESGLTGLAAADPSLEERVDVAAALAGGCLATAFVWIQHQGALAVAPEPWRSRLASGALRGGIAITALRPPDPLQAVRDGGAFVLDGRVPWVTGWGIAQVLRVAAVADDGRIVQLMVDAEPGIRALRYDLVAASSSSTVELAFQGHRVAGDRVVDWTTAEEWADADRAGLAGNGALALGVAGRAATLAGSAALADDVAAARADLLAADEAALPTARAACSALAMRAAAVLAVAAGAAGAVAGSDADRLTREALLTAVFGSRPAIRAALLARLT